MLHCFDAYPSESLLGQLNSVGSPQPDDGIQDFSNVPPAVPMPYDEVWNKTVGSTAAPASAPTVFSYSPSGSSYVTAVMVEKADGSVVLFNALTGAPIQTLTPPAPTMTGGLTTFPSVNAPAPTYYDGRIYAGQPNGDLYVYSVLGVGSAAAPGVRIPVSTTASPTEYVTASPAVGLLPNGETTNTVIAYVATNQNVYTILLGARNDAMVPYNTNGTQIGYNLNRNPEYFLNNIVVDMALNPSIFDATGAILQGATPNPGGQNPVFTTTNLGTYFTNWDVDFVNSLPNSGNPGSKGTLTLHEIKATSYADNANSSSTLSAPAMDRQGDYYYTVNDGTNSYLFGVHPDLLQRNVRLKFRFRMPLSNDPSVKDPNSNPWNYVDADNVDYSDSTVIAHNKQYSLLDFHFVGAPVADGQGNGYVVAQNKPETTAAVLCFNANQEITANAGTPGNPPPANFDPTQASYLQL
ncbi:MAG: hypothetical protein M3Y13_01585, partial [Armatimonadota bacterium]|nr:hypothetical protein [Armatimonadota bacterium]